MLDFSKVGAEQDAPVDAIFPAGQTVNLGSQAHDPEILEGTDKLNLPVAKARFDGYLEEVGRIETQANALEIVDDDSEKFAVALGGEAKKMAKQLDTRRRLVTEEAEDFVDKIKGLVKSLTAPLDRAEKTVKQKIAVYANKKELARREAARKAEEAQRELQKKLDAEAKEKGVEPVKVDVPVIPKQEKTVRAETGTSAHQVKRWVPTIVDPAKVPRAYCEPVMRLLNDAVKMGVREIPGCKIEEVTETRFRT